MHYKIIFKNFVNVLDFTSQAEVWLSFYEDDTFEQQLNDIITVTRPLYEQLHAYVRFKLRKFYGDIVPIDGSIPMHLLGDVWAQQWVNVNNSL